MTEPMVCAVMVTRNRPFLAARAISNFLAQTYKRSRLLVWDTSPQGPLLSMEGERVWIPTVDWTHFTGRTIGYARNRANHYACNHYTVKGTEAEILLHWDDDDFSHPKRIEEQVALLTSLGPAVECVGYREVLFWDTRPEARLKVNPLASAAYEAGEWQRLSTTAGEAWRFTHKHPAYVVGASMAYWAATWRLKPFRDMPAEDGDWWGRYSSICAAVSALDHPNPRMICQIHGNNTERYDRKVMQRADEFQRAPYFDQYCRQVFSGE